jgi:aspartate aminotransferase
VKTLGLSSRAELLKPSPTLAISAKAKAMKAQGLDIVSLSAGEPDFDTPDAICEAAVKALEAGQTKYTPTSGMIELKQAIVHKLKRENGLGVTPEQIVVSCGAKQSLYNSLMCLIGQGDEVILIAPYWMTYAEQVTLAGGTPVVVKTRPEDGFIPSVDDIRSRITDRTRAIIVNSPSNPTGAVFSRDILKGIAMLALRHGLWVITDEIYERLIYGEAHHSIAALGSDIADQTITISGCSKTYAMTGWRIGYAAAPVSVAKAMSNLQDQVTSNPTSFAQVGAIAALQLDPAEVERMRAEFEVRRNLIIDELHRIPGVEVPVPQGAFYVFPKVEHYLGGRIDNDCDLAEYLLDSAQVAVIPGAVFDGAGHLRLSYAASREDIHRGVERIAEALTTLNA